MCGCEIVVDTSPDSFVSSVVVAPVDSSDLHTIEAIGSLRELKTVPPPEKAFTNATKDKKRQRNRNERIMVGMNCLVQLLDDFLVYSLWTNQKITQRENPMLFVQSQG